MILPDDKKRISTIMASRKSAKGEPLGSASMKPEIVKTEDGEIDGRHTAAQDIMMALSGKSPESLMKALGNFQELHSSHIAKNPISED